MDGEISAQCVILNLEVTSASASRNIHLTLDTKEILEKLSKRDSHGGKTHNSVFFMLFLN